MSRIFNFISFKFNIFFKPFNYHFSSKLIYYDYYFYLNNLYTLLGNYNLYNFNYFFLKNFKNFFNAISTLLMCNFKFLSFDFNNKNLIYKNIFFNEVELLKYNFFFSNFSKVLKNQSFLHFYKFFLKKNNVKFLLVLDYEYYYNFLSYFNLLNVSVFSLIPHNYSSAYVDFYLMFNEKNNHFYKVICHSYLLYLINNVYEYKKNTYKRNFFNKITLIK